MDIEVGMDLIDEGLVLESCFHAPLGILHVLWLSEVLQVEGGSNPVGKCLSDVSYHN